MAFESLRGEKVLVSQTAQTFIFGDYFCVFDNSTDDSVIYRWSNVKSYVENLSALTFVTDDGITYALPKSCFTDNEQLIRCRSIAEGQLPAAVCRPGHRIIPPKYNYVSSELPEQSFSASCVYNEKDINPGSVVNIHTKTGKYLFLAAAAIAIIVFLCLNTILGGLEKNWYYYAPISVFSGIGISVIIYVITGITAKHRYFDFAKYDISTAEDITIVISKDGFSAVERCSYTGKELIPWTNVSYEFETKATFVLVCKDGYACWIPKRIFAKNIHNELSTFISTRTHSR